MRGAAPAPSDAGLAAALAGSRALLVYGLLGEFIARLRPVGLDYMASQADWLRGLGLPTTVIRLPTAAPVAANAERIAARLAEEPAPAVLVAHSKGGLECLAALLQPEAAAHCRVFIALQSPFHGSEVADAICGRRPLHRTLHHAARLLRLGDGEGLADLTTAARQAWMRAQADGVAELTRCLPVLTAAASLEAGGTWLDRIYRPLATWMEKQGAGPNDGLVSVRSATLPGVPQQVVPGGHRALVGRGAGRDPVEALRGLLRQALAQEARIAETRLTAGDARLGDQPAGKRGSAPRPGA